MAGGPDSAGATVPEIFAPETPTLKTPAEKVLPEEVADELKYAFVS